MKEIEFDHTSDKTHGALGIDDDRATEIEALILYQLAYQQVMRDKLFDDDEDVENIPSNFRTKSGILERSLEYARDEQEQIFITWEFCKIDIKTDMPVVGAAFMAVACNKLMTFDLDEQRFVNWFTKKKSEALSSEDDED